MVSSKSSGVWQDYTRWLVSESTDCTTKSTMVHDKILPASKYLRILEMSFVYSIIPENPASVIHIPWYTIVPWDDEMPILGDYSVGTSEVHW